jgi:hypothetical protein
MQDNRDIERREASLIVQLCEAHERVEILCEIMGVTENATLARIRMALGTLALGQSDDDGDGDGLGFFRGILIASAIMLPIYGIGLSLVLA